MESILNLTQHEPTLEQAHQGLCNGPNRGALQACLTFTSEDIRQGYIPARAASLAEYAAKQGAKQALIGGLPALMGPLVEALRARGIVPVFAHSERVSEDKVQPDGSVRKVNSFRHEFFYPAP